MRPFLVAFTALIAPGFAFAAPPQCALPSGPASAVLPPTAQPAVANSAPLPAPGLSVISAEKIERIPALKRVASKGATLYDLGVQHGLGGVFALQGQSFQVFYVTPDGQALIGGVMWEASGKNVTRDQVIPIEGAIPTVTIGAAAAAKPAPEGAPVVAVAQGVAGTPTDALKAVEATTFGLAGDTKAPRLWVYIDPLCSYSTRAMDQLRPYIASGRVQAAVIPLSVLDYEDQGRSTVAAKAMLSLPADRMVAAWGSNGLDGPADPAADRRLAVNMATAQAIGLRGTPTFLWRRADGTEGRADGMPANIDALIASLGS